MAVFALAGAGLTALGFGIGGDAWGWLVLAAFAVTLAAGLAAAFGVRRFVAALLLNLWFIVTLGIASSYHQHAHITSYTWAQVLAWAGGAALWIAVTFIAWLIRGRADRPQPVAAVSTSPDPGRAAAVRARASSPSSRGRCSPRPRSRRVASTSRSTSAQLSMSGAAARGRTSLDPGAVPSCHT
jgi:hypothetical protein